MPYILSVYAKKTYVGVLIVMPRVTDYSAVCLGDGHSVLCALTHYSLWSQCQRQETVYLNYSAFLLGNNIQDHDILITNKYNSIPEAKNGYFHQPFRKTDFSNFPYLLNFYSSHNETAQRNGSFCMLVPLFGAVNVCP